MAKEKIDKKEDKVSRIISAVANLKKNEFVSLSNLARKIDIHPHTLRDKLNEWDTYIEAGKIEIIRTGSEIRGVIVRPTDELELNFKKEIRESLKTIKNSLDTLGLEIKKKIK